MSDNITNTDEIRMLARAAGRDHVTHTAAIKTLARAVEALCDALDAHQHGYYSPRGLSGEWANTTRQVETDDKKHKAHLKASREKYERKS